MDLPGQITEILTRFGWLGPPLVIFLFLWRLTPCGKLHLPEMKSTRETYVGSLKDGRGWEIYRRYTGATLDWIDTRFSSPEVGRGSDPARVAYSQGLFGLLTVLALVYPVLGATAQWVSGAEISFASKVVLNAGSGFERTVFGAFFAGLVLLILMLPTRSRNLNLSLLGLACAALLFLRYGYGLLGLGDAFIAAFTGIMTIAFATGFAAAAGAALSGVHAACVAVAVATLTAASVSFGGGFAGLVPGLTSFLVVAFLGAMSLQGRLLPLIAMPIFGLAMPLVLAGLGAFRNLGTDDIYLLLLFAIFPLLNACADFASVGLTRFLLRDGIQRERARLTAILDLLGGAAIFAALGCVTIVYLHALNLMNGQLLFDLGELFANLDPDQGAPGQYWWLFFLLFTTLLPTALHAILMLSCLFLYFPSQLRRPIARLLAAADQGDVIVAFGGMLAFCAVLTIAASLVFYALYFGVALNHGEALFWIVDQFEAFARLIGAI
ncbi:MAG: hypothetical protein AAF576_08080 [Pseudomonadota bacterium]